MNIKLTKGTIFYGYDGNTYLMLRDEILLLETLQFESDDTVNLIVDLLNARQSIVKLPKVSFNAKARAKYIENPSLFDALIYFTPEIADNKVAIELGEQQLIVPQLMLLFRVAVLFDDQSVLYSEGTISWIDDVEFMKTMFFDKVPASDLAKDLFRILLNITAILKMTLDSDLSQSDLEGIPSQIEQAGFELYKIFCKEMLESKESEEV